MKDMENFTRLANKAQPLLLQTWLQDFEIPAPPSDEAEIKPWRKSLQETIHGLDNIRRANIEGMAERIVVLADRAGQEAITSLREIIPDIEELDAQPDAFNRSLWLFVKAPQRFAESEDSRFAIEYRMSPRLYSGFEGPAEQPIQLDQVRLDVLKEKVRDTLGIQGSILIEHFVRSAFSDNDDDVSLHHITVAYNAEQNSYEHIVDNQIETTFYVPAEKVHLTYEPQSGTIEIYSSSVHSARRDLARVFADTVLQREIEGEPIQLREFDLESLASPREFPIGDEPVVSVKLQMIKFRQDGYRSDDKGKKRPVDNTLAIQADRHDSRTIFEVARDEFQLSDFSSLVVKQVKIAIHLAKQPGQRARSIPVTITAPNNCSNSGLTENDRQLRDRLLESWGILVKF
ncbi:hypothetical protein [Ferriphaselus sp. R-1]|uniref:hypothetical protein n=1 Tax=Ferriphaselus sp. R-1 TaxID=1485544 RepID=UPI00054D9B55|nr:hypothetical protein [Ferriphaselus sp. R-1]